MKSSKVYPERRVSAARVMKNTINMGSRKFAYRMIQEGTTSFGRKKKNACRLVSTADIRRSQKLAKDSQVYQKDYTNCAVAFPKIKLSK